MSAPPTVPQEGRLTETEAILALRGVLDQLPAAVAVFMGPEHRFAFFNEAYRGLIGDRAREGMTAAEAVPEAAEQGFIALLDTVRQSGERFVGHEVQAYVREPGGGTREVFVDFIYQPFRGADGQVDGILVHAVEVTEAVHSRMELEEVRRREEQDRFRQAIESMIDTVIIASPLQDEDGSVADFTVAYINGGTDEVARRTREEVTGGRFTELWPAVHDSGLLDLYKRVMETGEPLVLEDYSYDDQIEGQTVGGVFDIRAARVGEDLFLAFRDVTERIQRERALAESRARLAQEHEVITSLQEALLPRDIPVIEGLRVGAEYVAASELIEVGGDWFDVFEVPDGRVALAIGDVAGKGLQAAQVMTQLRTAGRVAALGGGDPVEVLTAQNSLMMALGLGPFATALLAFFDPGQGLLSWASAGHLPPLLACEGEARYLTADSGPPLGVSEAPGYRLHTDEIARGERILLFTDGLVERRDEPLTAGLDRLLALVSSSGTPEECCRSLIEELGVAVTRADDVCVLALDRT